MKKKTIFISIILIFLILIFLSIFSEKEVEIPDRESLIPSDAIKMSPEIDKLPPILHSNEYAKPVPLPYPVNTKGAEDSAFIMPDGNTLYVWFTPSPSIDVTKQVIDKVTGIYEFKKQGDSWSDAKRLWFVKPGKPNLDGCGFFRDNTAWICGVREGYEGLRWLKSEFENNEWSYAEVSDFDENMEVGELDFYENKLYYHSSKTGGKGEYDIWVTEKNSNGTWTEPKNIEIINSPDTEGWPQRVGNELWFTRTYMGSPAIFRSKLINNEWQEPELILSQFAGESSVDNQGSIYFTHHYYEDGKMIEADIYVARKK